MSKLRAKLITLSILVGAVFGGFYTWSTLAGDKETGLTLSITTESGVISLGQPLMFKFELSNPTTGKIAVANPSEMTGNLRLLISSDGRNFRNYRGPDWGRRSSKRTEKVLAPGENITVETKVMFNNRPRTEHLTDLYSETSKRDVIDSVFAFGEIGHYWVKAVFDDRGEKIESQPVYIEVVEPAGSDAAVWSAVKDDPALVYLMHTGDLPLRPETTKFSAMIEKARSIAAENPESAMAASLGRSLTEMLSDSRISAR